MRRLGLISPTLSHATLGVFPLVLVFLAFILVFHFGATLPAFGCGKKLVLPAVAAPPAYLDGGDLLHISMQDDGDVFTGAKWYPAAELPAGLAKAVLHAPSVERVGVVVSADRSLHFSAVRRLLHLLSASGASRVILQVEASTPGGSLAGT